jgi:DNA-binding GntR family transcriptional regulator
MLTIRGTVSPWIARGCGAGHAEPDDQWRHGAACGDAAGVTMDMPSPGGIAADDARPETLASAVHAQLRRDIVAGLFRPGQKLLLREICARYGSGLAPVREALNRLTSDELVVQYDQRGFRVAPVSLAELEDQTETRCLLEGLCLRDSVAGNDAAWRAAAQAAHARLEAAEARALAGEVTYAEWELAHRGFHAALIAGGPSPLLRRLCAQLWVMAERYRHLTGQSGPATGPGRGAEHAGILEAALAGAAELAVERLQAHYRRTAIAVREALMRDAG